MSEERLKEIKTLKENPTFNDTREFYGLPRIENEKIEKLKCFNSDYYEKEGNFNFITNEGLVLDIITLKHKIDEIIGYINEENK